MAMLHIPYLRNYLSFLAYRTNVCLILEKAPENPQVPLPSWHPA